MIQIPHVSQQDLETYLTRLLPPENDWAVENHLATCRRCAARLTQWDNFSEALREMPSVRPDGSKENRRSPRFAPNGSGVLQVLNPFSVERLQVNISDVSREGMRLNVPTRVERGSLLKVNLENSLFFGEARYCEPAPDCVFYVGVRLHEFSHLDHLLPVAIERTKKSSGE
jgi:hypothetical protein